MKNQRKTMEDPGFCPRSQLTSAGLKVAKADFLSLASLTLVQDWCLLMDNRSTPMSWIYPLIQEGSNASKIRKCLSYVSRMLKYDTYLPIQPAVRYVSVGLCCCLWKTCWEAPDLSPFKVALSRCGIPQLMEATFSTSGVFPNIVWQTQCIFLAYS